MNWNLGQFYETKNYKGISMLYFLGRIMRFNCEFAVKNLLPAFRSVLAKQLITKHGLTQEQIATHLGLTQAAISQYVNSRRASKCRIMLGDDFFPVYSLACECRIMLGDDFFPVYSLACETAEKLVNGTTNIDEMKRAFCKVCTELREKYVENYVI